MKGISVAEQIMYVESAGGSVLIAENSLLGGPGVGSNQGVFDLRHVLDSLDDFD